MSIFGSIMRDFDHDPFFSNQMETMRRMESMMDNMMAPFGGMMGLGGLGFPRLSPPAPDVRRDPFASDSLMPFGFGRSLFPNIPNIFNNMSQMVQNPSMHSYSSSSVMTYTTDENGTPQVYQATSSTRTAPGGVKETRNSMRDSRSGLQKMAIGHHLGERAHIVEKERNGYTGELNENQEFINLEEEEAEAFNDEWREKARPFVGRNNRNAAIESRLRVEEVPAIMDAHSNAEADDDTPEPIITEPEDPIPAPPPPSRASSTISSISSGASSSASRKRESPDLSNHLHKPKGAEMKHKRRHHAYPHGATSKSGHRGDKSKAPKTRHETNI